MTAWSPDAQDAAESLKVRTAGPKWTREGLFRVNSTAMGISAGDGNSLRGR
jgi:hypothetical protein